MTVRGRSAAGKGAALALGVWIAALAGCVSGGVPDAELPEAPIAVSYLDPESARRRAEARGEQQEQRAETRRPGVVTDPPTFWNEQVAMATRESVSDYLGQLFGGIEEVQKFPARLALLDPRSGRITPIESARRGSLPQDWSQDRSRLLFAQPGDRDYQLYEYDLGARLVHPVTRGPFAHTQGCYASEGRLVVVAVDTRTTPFESHIAVSGPGGRRPYRRLSEGPRDHTPACAPDGRTVVFVSETTPERTSLWAVDVAGEAPPRLLSPGRHPRFSPDGEWVAFAAPYQRELRLWRMRPDGSGRTAVGRGVRHEARPAFSPDGRLLVYVSGEDPRRRQLYLRRFDGSGDRVLFADGDAEYPVW